MARFLLICLGGAAGTGARYLLATIVARAVGTGFPMGTLLVNVIGSFLLALVMQLSLTTELIGSDARIILGTGVLGGFTTYSTFNYETFALLRDGSWTMAAANVTATVLGCLLAAFAGIVIGRAIAA